MHDLAAPSLRRLSPRIAGLAFVVASMAPCAPAALAAGLTPLEAQRSLAGKWAGEGTTLTIDTERLQGNTDPERPFEWRAFRLLDVSGRLVVFDIGTARFLAMLEGGTLRLTGTGFAGERALHLVHR